MPAKNRLFIRWVLLAGLGSGLALMLAKVALHPAIFRSPGGTLQIVVTAILLLGYAGMAWWGTANGLTRLQPILLSATGIGLAAALVQIVNLVLENFLPASKWSHAIVLVLFGCTVLLWGTAGYRAARSPNGVASGMVAGAWCAIVTISLLVAAGFVIELYIATPRPEYVATWEEFKRSGWTDVSAFTIANTIDSAQSHLLLGPIVGAIVGAFAGILHKLPGGQRRNSRV